MKKFADWISKNNILILIVGLLLLIPAIIGYVNTRINYDILVYLPKEYETIKGENILTDEYGIGSYAFVISDMSDNYKVLQLEKKIKKIDGVNKVFSISDVVGVNIPKEMLPDEVTDKLYDKDTSIIMVAFDGTTSEDKTLNAVDELRHVVDANSVSSMSAMVLDTKNLSDQEIFAYIGIAVLLCIVVLMIATNSYIVPFFLLGNIGIAILYNMGSNIFLGQISYITQAIAAILQLGVTTDFSIFLYHKYELAKKSEKDKKRAMSSAIQETFKSVIGSSLTTFAGFLALCTMDLTLGTDIGIVMAKGVLFGLVCVLTIFPALLLTFDKLIEHTSHKPVTPQFKALQKFSVKHYIVVFILFLILMIPAIIGNSNYQVYYKLDDSLPKNLPFAVANSDLAKKFGITSPEIAIISKDFKNSEVEDMVDELKNIDGIDMVLAPSTLLESGMEDLLPDEAKEILDNDKYQLVIMNSKYEIASDELNNQIDVVNKTLHKYDKKSILAGEGPLMKDLVVTADHDFNMVNYTSIIVIFIIMLFVLQSIGLPVILIFTIEFAIFFNMAVAYYMGVKLPFIASIVVGTIQLGATIDYAILMSTTYLNERKLSDKHKAMTNTLKVTVPSIITSALCFFAATIGVSLYTKIDMIGSICTLLARGSIISMLVVVIILPALLMIFDKVILATTRIKKEGK